MGSLVLLDIFWRRGVIYTFIIGCQIITGKYDIILDASCLNDYSTLVNRPVLWSEVVSINPVVDQVYAAGATTDITYLYK